MEIKDYRLTLHKLGGEKSIFEIADEDIAGDPMYFGYLNSEGYWVIQQRSASAGSYRYAYGTSAYSTAWTARAGLSYGYYNEIFP